jgi:hypothetical protein
MCGQENSQKMVPTENIKHNNHKMEKWTALSGQKVK